MNTLLHIASDLTLPVEAVTQTFGILAKRGVGKCLSEESEIIDPITGVPHTIRQVVEGDRVHQVLTLNDQKCVVSTSITAKVDTGLNECLQVTFATGRSIVVTREHPFLTPDGWQRADSLMSGMSAALPARIPFPACPLSLEDAEIVLLAVLLAEGGYTQGRIRFSTTDSMLLDQVGQAAEAVGLAVKHLASQRPCDYHLVRIDQRTSNAARDLLRRYGIDGFKAKHKTIPSVIYQLPPQQLSRFLSVFWMCDGYIDSKGPGLTLASEQMVHQVQHLLLRFGIQSRIRAKKATSQGKVFAAFRLTVYASSYEAFYKSIPLWGEKQVRLAALCALTRNPNVGLPKVSPAFIASLRDLARTRSGRWNGGAMQQVARRLGWNTQYFQFDLLFNKNHSSSTLSLKRFQKFCEVFQCVDKYEWLWNSDIFWDTIVSVSPVGLRHTYDLTVSPTACFVANDIIVHNTYLALVMAEEMIKAGLHVVIIDPVGVCWGLRASADGERPGLPIVVMGGDHGDVPLEAQAGEIIANFVIDEGQSAVLDLSHLRRQQQIRFVTDFAECLYLRNRDPLHLILDEADIFAPQQVRRGYERMLETIEDIVRRGRARGLGVSLVTQRSAVVNKDVLSQVEVLIALRTISPGDIDSIDAWVKRHGTPEKRNILTASLPSLPIGTAWFWSPGWLELFQQVHIRARDTFDSSATPQVGQQRKTPKHLAEIDLSALSARIAATIEHAKTSDPKHLRARIAELEEQIRQRVAPAEKVREVVKTVVERVEVPVFQHGEVERLERAVAMLRETNGAVTIASQDVQTAVSRVLQVRQQSHDLPGSPVLPSDRPTSVHFSEEEGKAAEGGQEAQPLRAGERKMLEVLARHFPMKVTRAQLGTLANYASSGGTFGTYLGTLKRHGYIAEPSRGEVTITPAGLAHLGISVRPEPQSSEAFIKMWLEALRLGERKMLTALISAYPNSLSRDELGTQVDMTPSGGTFGTYLGTLRRNGLIEVEGDSVRASTILFDRERK